MKALRTARVSEEEFLALPESLDKVELVDGEVVMTPAPSAAHQILVQRILIALSDWARQQSRVVTVGHAPWDIRFRRGRILQPDVFVIFDEVPFEQEGPLARVPELCVEVLSTNRVHDRVTKRLLYAEAGVLEYWIVDPAGLVERWNGPGLTQGSDVEKTLTSELLPEFQLDLVALFRRSTSAGPGA